MGRFLFHLLPPPFLDMRCLPIIAYPPLDTYQGVRFCGFYAFGIAFLWRFKYLSLVSYLMPARAGNFFVFSFTVVYQYLVR